MNDRRDPDVTDRRAQQFDLVEKPKHYNIHPSGLEAIELTELPNANLSNALKYCWRASEKGNRAQDLGKARWYAQRHCNNFVHVPIFSSQTVLEIFVNKATAVIKHEEEGSLLAVALQALADGEPRRLLLRIEEELRYGQ